MAINRKPSLIPVHNKHDIDESVNEFVDSIEMKTIKVFQYVGEGFVNDYRSLRTYKDVTGNLRASGGYTIAVDAAIEAENNDGGDQPTPEGTRKARNLGKQLAKGKGIVLVGVAGMEYGADVEARGKDVITGPALLAEKKLKELMLLL